MVGWLNGGRLGCTNLGFEENRLGRLGFWVSLNQKLRILSDRLFFSLKLPEGYCASHRSRPHPAHPNSRECEYPRCGAGICHPQSCPAKELCLYQSSGRSSPPFVGTSSPLLAEVGSWKATGGKKKGRDRGSLKMIHTPQSVTQGYHECKMRSNKNDKINYNIVLKFRIRYKRLRYSPSPNKLSADHGFELHGATR